MQHVPDIRDSRRNRGRLARLGSVTADILDLTLQQRRIIAFASDVTLPARRKAPPVLPPTGLQ